VVEHIGMKSTRVRTPTGDQLIFSNADLLKSRIRNCKKTTEQRVAFSIGVALDTEPRLVADIPSLLKRAIEGQPGARFDRSHFKEIGASSFVFETVFFVAGLDPKIQLDVQQAVNLAILESFAANGVSLALPTQAIVVERARSQSASHREREAARGVDEVR
jgi:small-conductance mechanosensitive channel